MRLEGQRALVTGGASGIGAATAARLAAEGAAVVIGDLNADGARAMAAEIGAESAALDVTDPQSAIDLVAEHGPFSILVNNAGTDEFGFFADTDPGQWQRVTAVNLFGVFACTHAVLPGMQEAGYGRIVSVASEAGRIGSKGSAVYSAAKGGVIAFMKVIAREGARFGITANSIAPGPIETPLLMQALEFGEIGNKIVENMKGDDPAAAPRSARGGRRRDRIPRLRRFVLRHRRDARRFRRDGDGGLAGAGARNGARRRVRR